MAYRIITTIPFEGTSPADPHSISAIARDGILTARYALKLAHIIANDEANYDVDVTVYDGNGRRVHLSDFECDAHVRARVEFNRLNDECPF